MNKNIQKLIDQSLALMVSEVLEGAKNLKLSALWYDLSFGTTTHVLPNVTLVDLL